MRDLCEHDVDLLTIGQYLRPSMQHLPIERYVPLEEFAAVKKRKGDWTISSENFPAISSLGETLDQIFEAGPENPARLFANLAHQ